jgi:hypothetical protein
LTLVRAGLTWQCRAKSVFIGNLVMHSRLEPVTPQVAGETVRVAVFVEILRPRVRAGINHVVMIAAVDQADRSAYAADVPGKVVGFVVIVDVPRYPAVERVVDVNFVMIVMTLMLAMRRSGNRGGRGYGNEAQRNNGKAK